MLEDYREKLELLKKLDCTPDKRFAWFVEYFLELMENPNNCVSKLIEKIPKGIDILHQYIPPRDIDAELLEGSVIKTTCYINGNGNEFGKNLRRNGKCHSSDIDILVIQSKDSELDGGIFEKRIDCINKEIAESNGGNVIYDFTGIRNGVCNSEWDFYCYVVCRCSEDTTLDIRKLEESLKIGCAVYGNQPDLYNGIDKYIIGNFIRAKFLKNNPLSIPEVIKISPLPVIALKSFGAHNPRKTCVKVC